MEINLKLGNSPKKGNFRLTQVHKCKDVSCCYSWSSRAFPHCTSFSDLGILMEYMIARISEVTYSYRTYKPSVSALVSLL